MQSQIRAFIAIELSSGIKSAIKDIQSNLKQTAGNSVKWVEPANIHLTLKFLGNVSSLQIGAIFSAMQSAAQNIPPFCLQLQGLGAFPNLNRIQVIWIGLNGELDVLVGLQKNLDSNLAKLAFAPENKPFSPHLTLGRVRETATLIDKQNIGRAMSAARVECPAVINVQSLNLMQSQLSSSSPVYTCLKSAALADLRH